MAYDNRKPRREKEFTGYYVDCSRYGNDPIKAFRKLKRMYKDTRFFEEMRDRQYYIKPTTKRREEKKRKQQTLRRLQRERDSLRGIKRPQKK